MFKALSVHNCGLSHLGEASWGRKHREGKDKIRLCFSEEFYEGRSSEIDGQNLARGEVGILRITEHNSVTIDLEKCLEGLVKLVMTSYRLGELSGGFGETSYDQLETWRNVRRVQ